MTAPWPFKPFTFRALQKTFGPMWVRCDTCRRYATLPLTGLLDADYRTKRFGCFCCGAEAWVCVVEAVKETDMHDYRLDEIEIRSATLPPSAGSLAAVERCRSIIAAANCPDARLPPAIVPACRREISQKDSALRWN